MLAIVSTALRHAISSGAFSASLFVYVRCGIRAATMINIDDKLRAVVAIYGAPRLQLHGNVGTHTHTSIFIEFGLCIKSGGKRLNATTLP